MAGRWLAREVVQPVRVRCEAVPAPFGSSRNEAVRVEAQPCPHEDSEREPESLPSYVVRKVEDSPHAVDDTEYLRQSYLRR